MLLKTLSRFGLDGFLISLVSVVVLACVAPELGRTGGTVRLELFTNYGVALVFLLYGLTLSWDKLKAGLLNWRLHILVQSSTFVMFPLLVWGVLLALGRAVPAEMALGFFFLAALPSTISSSVAMTSIAGGNVAGAIFNASLSSLVGVAMTPLWVDWYLSTSGQSLDLLHVLGKIVMLVVVPIVAGQVLQPFVKRWMHRHAKAVKLLDRATILAIVLNSFSDSVAEGVWSGRGAAELAALIGGSIVLFAVVFVALLLVCRALGFNHGDQVAGVFCGTKKSLAAGVPMAKIMFGGSPILGMVIAPTILYHFIQLVAASIIARGWKDKGA